MVKRFTSREHTLGPMLTGAEIRQMRTALELSQHGLAQLLGVGGNAISRWENDKWPMPAAYALLLLLLTDVPSARAYIVESRACAPRPRSSAQPGQYSYWKMRDQWEQWQAWLTRVAGPQSARFERAPSVYETDAGPTSDLRVGPCRPSNATEKIP